VSARSLASVLVPAAAGAIALACIAPWLYPCIGASRFAECIDPELISSSDSYGPETWCYLGICDWFPSALERMGRIAVILAVIVGAGIIGSRTVRIDNMRFGIATSVATVVLAAGAIWYAYPWAAA
jgi:hypothetical protein